VGRLQAAQKGNKMPDRFIYSNTGALAYRVSDQGSSIFIYNAQGQLAYRYDRAANITYDATGGIVMFGSILPNLS
jgi:hypothetical protein